MSQFPTKKKQTRNAEVPGSLKRNRESETQESKKGISEIEGKAVRVAAKERG